MIVSLVGLKAVVEKVLVNKGGGQTAQGENGRNGDKKKEDEEKVYQTMAVGASRSLGHSMKANMESEIGDNTNSRAPTVRKGIHISKHPLRREGL